MMEMDVECGRRRRSGARGVVGRRAHARASIDEHTAPRLCVGRLSRTRRASSFEGVCLVTRSRASRVYLVCISRVSRGYLARTATQRQKPTLNRIWAATWTPSPLRAWPETSTLTRSTARRTSWIAQSRGISSRGGGGAQRVHGTHHLELLTWRGPWVARTRARLVLRPRRARSASTTRCCSR